MGKAIAADINLSNQGNETNIKNVKFDVYLDEADRNVKEKTADISSEDMKLYISASVQGGGYLNNAQVELISTNFKLKNNPEVTKFKLDSIQSEKGIAAGLPIVSKKDESYNLNLLDMQSQIRLTGEYIDENGNVTDIDTTKAVKITWTADELTEEDVELDQEVITNKIYNIDGANKRIVQILVKSKIKDNKAPVKSSIIEIANPEIGVAPEEVKVAGYTTKATNGKTSLEFADGENSSWEYKAEEGKTYIQIANNANEDNIVAWAKDTQDRFVVTYIYDEAAVVAPFISSVKNTVNIYGRTEAAIEKTNNIELEELVEVGDILKLETTVTENIYKGKMYIAEDTNYKTKANVYVPYSKLTNSVTIEDLGDTIIATEDAETEGISTYYKTTKINKAEALKVLGTEGTIKVYNSEDKTNPIQEIVLSEEIEEDYYTISYNENISKIAIEMTAAKTEGTIEIVNEKIIKVSNTEIVANLVELKTNTNLNVADVNGSVIVNSNIEKTAKLLEPKTTFNTTLNKAVLSALSENDVRITAELIAKDETNKLYKNPSINIELPKEVKEVSIENITPVVGSDELTVKSHDVIANEAGNKVIVVELQGEQTTYSVNSATITIDAKISINEFMADKNVEVKATSINDGETVQLVKPLKIGSKEGLVTKSIVKVGEKAVEKVNQSKVTVNANENDEVAVATLVMNNYGDTLTGAAIEGKIPEQATLNSEVTTNIEGATVKYYTEDGTEATDLSQVKSFKIETNKELMQGEVAGISYKYILNNEATEVQESTLKVEGTVAEDNKEEVLTYVANIGEKANLQATGTTTNAEKVQVNVISTVGGEEIAKGAEVNNGQVIRYKVTVTNTSNEDLENVVVKPSVENGKFYALAEDGGTYYDAATGQMLPGHRYAEVETIEDITVGNMLAGETKEIEYQTIAYLGDGENANQFKAKIDIIANGMEPIFSEDIKTIKEGKIALRVHYSSNEEPILFSGGSIMTFEVEIINLTDTELNNIPVKIDLPEELYCNVNEQMHFDKEQAIMELVGNTLNINVNNLTSKENKKIFIQLETNDLPKDELERDVEINVISDFEGTTYKSNEYIKTMYQFKTNIDASFISNKMNETIYVGDEIVYTLKLENNGLLDEIELSIIDKFTYGMNVESVTIKKGSEDPIVCEYEDNGNNIAIDGLELKKGETLVLTFKAIISNIQGANGEMTNTVVVSGGRIDNIEKTLTNAVELSADEPGIPSDPSDPNDPNNPNNPSDPSDPSNPDDPTIPENPGENNDKNSISGLAWLDENKDGIRNENEKVLQAVKVILLDKAGKQVKEATTSLTGTYKFADVEQGDYIVVFEYDTSKYAVTKYQVSSATTETNSDAISKQMEINGETKTVGATDIIKVDEKTSNTNIDIGLIENAKFDLSLNKYVSKVVLTNSSGTTTYEYEDTNFAKVEISAKKIAGTTMVVEYELQITNEGDVDSYVGDVIDYLPDGLVFTSETNKDWYMDGSGILHNKTLAEQVIKAGETKSVTLVLTKALKSDSTGTIENIGEIGASSNKLGLTEYDSVAGNKKAGEDDMSTASLIVSIATGTPLMYIGIVIGSMAILGAGIYIINKKVLKERI